MIKIIDKYAQIKRFHHDSWLQLYIYAFMYVDTENIPEDDYLPATKILVDNCKKKVNLCTCTKTLAWI